MLRMTRPEKLRIIQGSTWDGYFGGSEANVAVSLAMLGNDVEYVTRLPDNKLGQACLNELRKYNVGTRFVTRGGIRLGTYYYENAAAMRGSSVVYDRADSSMTTVAKGTINWTDAFADASVFHWSGISCALSQSAADVTEEAVCEAERQGLAISFDINYRKNLWKYGKSAHDILLPLAKKCDIMFGTEGEWQLLTRRLHSRIHSCPTEVWRRQPEGHQLRPHRLCHQEQHTRRLQPNHRGGNNRSVRECRKKHRINKNGA